MLSMSDVLWDTGLRRPAPKRPFSSGARQAFRCRRPMTRVPRVTDGSGGGLVYRMILIANPTADGAVWCTV